MLHALGIWDYVTAVVPELSYEDIDVFVNFSRATETEFETQVGKKEIEVDIPYLRRLFNIPQPEEAAPNEDDIEYQAAKVIQMQAFYERCVTEDGLKKFPKFKSYIDKNLLMPGWAAIATVIQEVFSKNTGV